MGMEDYNSGVKAPVPAVPCIAEVVSNFDPVFMGGLEVRLEHAGAGNTNSTTQVFAVKMLTPFYGNTSKEYVNKDPDNYNNSQKVYGMWMAPPDVGTRVIVIFINGDPSKGYWIGCVPAAFMNFSLPGLAATAALVDGETDNYQDNDGVDILLSDIEATRLPVSEFNKEVEENNVEGNTTLLKKPRHLFTDILYKQGLLKDDIRGITSSSARRESPSMVFGISTPGPTDKRPGSPRGSVGTEEDPYKTAPVSRLGGTTFVMDDGDAAFLRKTPADQGPPEYVSVEAGEQEGDVRVPHNELVRIRTRTGHQILLHNSEDLIYIGNGKGTAWIELTSHGKIDIYSKDSISVHTEQDLNFFATRDINLEAGRNYNIKVGSQVDKDAIGNSGQGEMHTHVLGDNLKIVEGNERIHVLQDVTVTHDKIYKKTQRGIAHYTYDDNLKTKIYGDHQINTTGKFFHTVTKNIEINAAAKVLVTATGSLELSSAADNKFTAGGSTNIKSGGNHLETAAQIHMNGPAASPAIPASLAEKALVIDNREYPRILKTVSLPGPDGHELFKSIMCRIPTMEPWPHHENLDPLVFAQDKTDRDAADRYATYKFSKYDKTGEIRENAGDVLNKNTDLAENPTTWKQYTTKTDTFKPPPPQVEE